MPSFKNIAFICTAIFVVLILNDIFLILVFNKKDKEKIVLKEQVSNNIPITKNPIVTSNDEVKNSDPIDVDDSNKKETREEKISKTFSEIRNEEIEYFSKRGGVEVSVIEGTVGGMIKVKIISTGEVIFIDMVRGLKIVNDQTEKTETYNHNKEYIRYVNAFARDMHNSNKAIWFVEDKSRSSKLVNRNKIYIHYGVVYESKVMPSFSTSYDAYLRSFYEISTLKNRREQDVLEGRLKE